MTTQNAPTRTGRTLRRAAFGTLAGAALLSGAGLSVTPANAATPAVGSAPVHQLKGGIEPPGIGEIINGGIEIYKQVELCKANKEAGLPCMQDTAKTVTQIYTKLDNYIKQYAVDQKRNEDAISAISHDVKNNTYDQNMLALTSDFQRATVGMNLYRAMGACSDAYVNANTEDGLKKSTKAPTCPNVNAEGNREGDQVANMESINRERDAFIASQEPSKYNVKGANDMLNRVGGTKANSSANPYNTNSIGILNKLVDRDRGQEKEALGLGVTDKLQFMGPGYVNKVGSDVTSITNAESNYFVVRGIEQQFVKRAGETGNEWSNAATHGGSNGEMSIADQTKAFTFPDWSPSNPMKSNESYVQMKKGTYVKLTNHGMTTTNPGAFDGLLTPEQMAEVTAVVGPILSKDKVQSMYPGVLPKVEGNRPLGNAAGQAGRDDAATRWWTTPQSITEGAHADGHDRILLGSKLRAKQAKRMKPTHWKTREAAAYNVKQQSIPYSVFKAPTDTIRGVADASINLGHSAYVGYCGSDLSDKPFTCKGPNYGGNSPVNLYWDAWATAHGDSTNYRGITSYQAPTWDWFRGANGLAVRYDGITAANVTSAPVPSSGLLVGAA